MTIHFIQVQEINFGGNFKLTSFGRRVECAHNSTYKKLADDNKPIKYLRYAIGEIVLVVIGILIALSINNWNQNQKDRKLGVEYLNRIITDVRKDTTILNQKISLDDKLSKEYLNHILEMYKKQESKEDYVQLLNSIEFNVDELLLTDITYSELVNTGKLDLIFNNNLKDQITEYYRYYEFVSSRVSELNKSNLTVLQALGGAMNLKYVALNFKDFLPANFSEDYMYNDADWAYINNPKSMEFKSYENAIYYYYLKQVLLKPMYSTLNSKAVKLLDSIRKELTE